MNKRDALLSVLESSKPQEYVPAAFFTHFPPEYHGGQAAVEKHLEFFRFTGMDFIKIQYERKFPPVPQIRRPEDWAKIPFYDLEFYEPQLQAVEGLVKAAKSEALVLCTLYSPLMCAGHTTSHETVTAHLSEDPDAVAKGLERVVVPLPAIPVDASVEESIPVRNIAKKLFVGMEAHDYAEDVSSTGNPAWIDLIIKSEADGDEPPSPGAVFFRWEFKDEAAMAAFVANELPPGFELAPTQFLESDAPKGEYFLALMLYNAGGGSIVDGARAEWDVFVRPPKGADPDSPDRPRYMIIQALSAKVSGDPATLLTDASPVSYELRGDQVVSSVGQLVDGREVPVFSSSFPRPDPDEAEPMRWTADMAIANDYMHWPNGVYDHIVYNASTYNWEGYFVDTENNVFGIHEPDENAK